MLSTTSNVFNNVCQKLKRFAAEFHIIVERQFDHYVEAGLETASSQPDLAVILSLLPAFAQRKVDLRNTYERLVCVVPMIGAGTPSDPRRPMYAPVPGGQPAREGIIAFSYQLSDNGQYALVEFVARDHAGLAAILADKDLRTDVKVFEKAEAKREDIEREFRKHKRSFDFSRFGVSVP